MRLSKPRGTASAGVCTQEGLTLVLRAFHRSHGYLQAQEIGKPRSPALGYQHSKDMDLFNQVQRRHQDHQKNGAALLGGRARRVGIV